MSRTVPSPKTLELAQRLLDYEAATGDSSGANMPAALRVSEKLRRPLSTLAGAAGFRALLARALALTKAQSHGFSAVHLQPDGFLEGLTELHNDEATESGAMLIAHLFGLLITFIGENLTVRLMHDAWPDLPFDGANHGEQN